MLLVLELYFVCLFACLLFLSSLRVLCSKGKFLLHPSNRLMAHLVLHNVRYLFPLHVHWPGSWELDEVHQKISLLDRKLLFLVLSSKENFVLVQIYNMFDFDVCKSCLKSFCASKGCDCIWNVNSVHPQCIQFHSGFCVMINYSISLVLAAVFYNLQFVSRHSRLQINFLGHLKDTSCISFICECHGKYVACGNKLLKSPNQILSS